MYLIHKWIHKYIQFIKVFFNILINLIPVYPLFQQYFLGLIFLEPSLQTSVSLAWPLNHLNCLVSAIRGGVWRHRTTGVSSDTILLSTRCKCFSHGRLCFKTVQLFHCFTWLLRRRLKINHTFTESIIWWTSNLAIIKYTKRNPGIL